MSCVANEFYTSAQYNVRNCIRQLVTFLTVNYQWFQLYNIHIITLFIILIEICASSLSAVHCKTVCYNYASITTHSIKLPSFDSYLLSFMPTLFNCNLILTTLTFI